MIKNMEAIEEPKNNTELDIDRDDLSLNEEGEVELKDDMVIGQTQEVFGEKIYDDIVDQFVSDIEEMNIPVPPSPQEELLQKLQVEFKNLAVQPVLEKANENYLTDVKIGDKKRIERKLTVEGNRLVNRAVGDYNITQAQIERDRKEALENATITDWVKVNSEYDKKQQAAIEDLKTRIVESADNFAREASREVIEAVETKKKENLKNSVESAIRDHLRGFTRTIPSFLMAYGENNVTLATFDTIIPDNVFIEVTGITLAQFRFLRDGGDYLDEETGEQKHFAGNLFEPVVFDDSVREFLRMKTELADYFDESQKEDIFDYIPPQRTNQIYTPKKMVIKMVDMLEEENPGCYDNPSKTFIDLYMKSGLYITEIVKRLYHSDNMVALYPDGNERLKHIFAKQVYGLAPTEIIYRIAMSYILGFDKEHIITEHNLRLYDALPDAKAGTLQQALDTLFENEHLK